MVNGKLTERLSKLKESIESYKAQASRAEGARDALLKKFSSEFGIESIEQGQQEVKKLQAEILAMEDKLEQGLAEIEEALSR